MKLIYIVAAVAMLAMLIPAMAIPVSAQSYTISLAAANGDPDVGYNVTGYEVIATLLDNGQPVGDGVVTAWDIQNDTAGGHFVGTPNTQSPIPGSVTVANTQNGESQIVAYIGTTKVATADKKWSTIDHTVMSAAGSSTLSWNQSTSAWYGEQTLTDTVYGAFPVTPMHVAQGVTLNWYLFDSHVTLPTAGTPNDEPAGWMSALSSLQRATFVQFVDPTVANFDSSNPMSPGWLGTNITTLTDSTGMSTVKIGAWGAESVKIVVVPEYPNSSLQTPVELEVNTWSFSIAEMGGVPQVRWIGEKIVLEKNYTQDLTGALVNFTISTGSADAILEPVGTVLSAYFNGFNLISNGRSVWTVVDEEGMASVILTSDSPEQVKVRVALYGDQDDFIIGQSEFNVFFLKFETLNLSDVPGKRSGHDSGVWTEPTNPYNQYFPAPAIGDLTSPKANDDVLEQPRNVSQDALERAQVRGWFIGVNASTRAQAYQDTGLADKVFDFTGSNPPLKADYAGYTPDITLPYGRWVLPDDWAALAPTRAADRLHWDIMDSPSDTVVSSAVYGPYLVGQATPVIGPFSPGLEVMTLTGWVLSMTSPDHVVDSVRQIKTVVPNHVVDAWDAPMPPAKIIFNILDGNGYFKATNKADIYVDATGYTNPFYAELIPAHWAIPAFGDGANTTGYSWNSFVSTYGPYVFWTQILLPSNASDELPTEFEVYSDNHGEAMAYLNGDYNLDLKGLGLIKGKDGADISEGTVVGTTTLSAVADYPYVLGDEQSITSNTVEKTWLWGGIVLGIDAHTYADGSTTPASLNILSAGTYTQTIGNPGDALGKGTSNDHVIFVWACDRDGRQAGMIGARVDWTISNGSAYFQTFHAVNNLNWVSAYNEITQNIFLNNNGFLDGTNGVLTGTGIIKTGYSFMTAPNKYERQLFFKNWPALYDDPTGVKPINFAVAAIDIYQTDATDITIQTNISGTDFGYTGHPVGEVDFQTNLLGGNTGVYPLDDPIVAGDANNDGKVNAADITACERIIMGLDPVDVNADTNMNGVVDMGDVVKIIRIIRGLD